MKKKAEAEKKKRFVVLQSESDFYFFIEQRLREEGFEVFDIFSRIREGNVPKLSYLDKSP